MKTSKRTDWKKMREEMNALHDRLLQKPECWKQDFHHNAGSILNAYQEGDITFSQAVAILEELIGPPVASAATPAKKWEYQKSYVPTGLDEIDFLNQQGLGGWELVTITRHNPPVLIWKRPLSDSLPEPPAGAGVPVEGHTDFSGTFHPEARRY